MVLSVDRVKLLSLLYQGFNSFDGGTQPYQDRMVEKLNLVLNTNAANTSKPLKPDLIVESKAVVLFCKEVFKKGLKNKCKFPLFRTVY